MKPLLRQHLETISDPAEQRNLTREYLQSRILLALEDLGAFSNWAFLGGTALRFLFALPRYSEDLDFSTARVGGCDRASFEKMIHGVESDLSKQAYTIESRVRADKTVMSAWIKFRGLLNEIGISPHRDEVISIKIEIDTRPPGGANLETRIIRRFDVLNLLHYDRASLLAGKLHAVLMREYTKGRDLYDLAWYLSDRQWPEPNLVLLNNALKQTGWMGGEAARDSWRDLVAVKLQTVDWKSARADVLPFLQRPKDIDWISLESIRSLLNDPF